MSMSMRPLHLLRSGGGMTLLEVMLALFVLAVVVSMVSMTLSGSLNVVEATRTQGELYYRAQVALQRISEDLASAALVDGAEFVGVHTGQSGQSESTLAFASTAHVVFDPVHDHPGMARISYSLVADEDNEGELLLLRADELLPGSGGPGKGYLLCDRLRAVTFTYIDEKGDEQETWDTTVDPNQINPPPRKLPVSVLCTLEFWVDREAEASIKFTTRILLPVGLINVEKT